VPLAVVDLSPVPPGGTATDAYANSVLLAQGVEAAGYQRYWVAEHHGIGHAVAGVCPEVLVGRIAAATSTIRVGAGVALLNYSTPLRLAETYRALTAMYGDRIDLGIGRAESPPAVEAALKPPTRDLSWAMQDGAAGGSRLDAMTAMMDYEDDVTEVVGWLDGSFTEQDPRAGVRLVAAASARPQPWLLGTSMTSAMLAGRLGLPYGFAAFFNPTAAVAAMRAYRMCFAPSTHPSGLQTPYAMLAVNACCADTDREADRLRASAELFYESGGVGRRPLVDADDAVAELGGVPKPTTLDGAWPRHLSGGPTRLAAMLEQMAAETGADELMIQDLITDQRDRLRSYQLIADACALVSA
jgi:luciferase family oxidoreductase group 1